MEHTTLQKQLINHPLLCTRFTDKEIEQIAVQFKGKNIFFGAGLVTQDQVSVATPFDILSMFFTAEQFRRFTGGKKIFVFIADQHAQTNTHLSQNLVIKRTNETFHLFEKIIHNFHLKHFTLIRTSDLNRVPEIRSIFAKLPDFHNDYVKHEVADVCWLQKFHNVGIKLGWSMSSSVTIGGHDERFFDQTIHIFCPNVLFVHLEPGRTFDDKRPRVSPYIAIQGEKRLLLQKNTDVRKTIETLKTGCSIEVAKAAIRHLSKITRLHDDLFGPMKHKMLTEKLQILMDTATTEFELKKGGE